MDGLTHHPRTDGSTHRRQGPTSLRWTTRSPRDHNIAPACDLWPPASRRAHRWLCGALTPVRPPEPVARKPPRQAACEQWRPGGGRPRAESVVNARGGRYNGSPPRTALTWLLVGLTRWRVTVARIHQGGPLYWCPRGAVLRTIGGLLPGGVPPQVEIQKHTNSPRAGYIINIRNIRNRGLFIGRNETHDLIRSHL